MTKSGARRGGSKQRKQARKPVTNQKSKPEQATSGDTELGAGVHLSISSAAEEFGHDRRTITKRLAELGLKPAGERQGYPVYRLRDLLEMERKAPDGKHDPDKMSPFERQAHYKAESEKLKVDLERGALMRREDAESEWSKVINVIAMELDTIVDEIERDIGASPLVLEKIEAKLDVIRERMYVGVIALADTTESEVELQQVGEADGTRAIHPTE